MQGHALEFSSGKPSTFYLERVSHPHLKWLRSNIPLLVSTFIYFSSLFQTFVSFTTTKPSIFGKTKNIQIPYHNRIVFLRPTVESNSCISRAKLFLLHTTDCRGNFWEVNSEFNQQITAYFPHDEISSYFRTTVDSLG